MINENKLKPLVSVVIPCFNHEYFVQKCIVSVIDQDYENIELIIIDDGSADQSIKKIEELLVLCKGRFKRFEFRQRENKGLCFTLNEAIEWSRGIYFSPVASDDFLHKSKISKQVDVFLKSKNEKLAVVFTGIKLIDINDRVLSERGRNEKYDFKEVFLREAFTPGPAAMILKSALVKVGGYDQKRKIEDLYLFLKLSSEGFVLQSIKESLVFYRRHADNLSSKSEVMWEAVNSILSEYSNHRLYNKALSRSMLIHAHSLQVESKIKSIPWAFKAIKTDYKILFNVQFFKWFLKIFIIKFN